MIHLANKITRTGKFATMIFASGVLITGCDARGGKSDTSKVQALVSASKANMIHVDGGEFQMGDFGEINAPEKLPYSSASDDKPYHKVRLSSFSISRYKVSYDEYDVYAAANGLPSALKDEVPNASEKKYRKLPGANAFPVAVLWDQAHAYCHWLGKQSGQSMDLPTEAQWEYAARSRGQYAIFATDNGKFDPSRNTPTEDDVEKLSGSIYAPIKIGSYPPNSLGLYDMAKNGLEWVKDWYSEDYYSHSPEQDPQGPETGTKRVLRDAGNEDKYPAMTFHRHFSEPEGYSQKDVEEDKGLGIALQKAVFSFRCAASDSPAVK